MNNSDEYLYKSECYDIIGCCMEVHSELGCGFLEKVYQEVLELEFRNNTIPFERESEIDIFYKAQKINQKYYADFLCFDEVILELKAVKKLDDIHFAQIMNYMKATGKRIGLLVNFGGKSLEYKRVIL